MAEHGSVENLGVWLPRRSDVWGGQGKLHHMRCYSAALYRKILGVGGYSREGVQRGPLERFERGEIGVVLTLKKRWVGSLCGHGTNQGVVLFRKLYCLCTGLLRYRVFVTVSVDSASIRPRAAFHCFKANLFLLYAVSSPLHSVM